MAEFECVKDSLLALNDAIENAAWKPEAARSVRFTIKYGHLEFVSGTTFTVNASVNGDTTPPYSDTTGFIRYCIQTKYVTFGGGYRSYILGSESLVVNSTSESCGRVLIEQGSGWVNITLSYRALVMRTSYREVEGDMVNYVDIWIIKLTTEQHSVYFGDFDLKVKCNSVTTQSLSDETLPADGVCTVNVGFDGESSSVPVELDPGEVAFNVIIAEIEVG
ncbi:MAG: hypothetical protein ACTSUS_02575 [Candidatus Freyarchaeota archaeon]